MSDKKDIRISILIVDDKKFMREDIKSYIINNPTKKIGSIEYDFDISMAEDGEKAILMYGSENHEIIVMDLGMDKMDGIEATKNILEMNPKARIIGMASEGEAKVEEFKSSGIKYFLEKPFQSTYINSKIDSMIKDILQEKPLDELDAKKKKKSLWKKIISK